MTFRGSSIVPFALAVAACGGTVTQSGPAGGQQIAVTVQPPSPQVAPGGTVAFAATVTGTANTSVVWSVLEGTTGGAIDGVGLYRAPGSAGTFHVVATSQADATQSGSATVTVGALSPPAAPSNAVAVATSATGITLTWTNNATSQTGFHIERSGTSGTAGFAQIAAPGANSTSYNDAGLAPSTQYWYRVAAVNAAGTSAFSNVATATTQPPGSGAVARPAYNTGTGFFTLNGRIYDANGFEFVPYGMNGGNYNATWQTCTTDCGIPNSGANFVRWFAWDDGPRNYPGFNTTATTLRSQRIVSVPTCANNGPNLTTNTETNDNSLVLCTDAYLSTAAQNVYKPLERYLMLGMANEWGAGTDGTCGPGRTEWRNAYIAQVQRLRAGGYTHTLVIDAGGGGANEDCIYYQAQAIYDADPQHNILFNWHDYGYDPATSAATALAMAASRTATAGAYGGFPLWVGEFGTYPGGYGTVTALQAIAHADAAGLGWSAWAYDGPPGAFAILNPPCNDPPWTCTWQLNQSGPAAGEPANCTVPGPCTTSPCNCTHASDLSQYGNDVILNPTSGLFYRRAPKATVF